MRSTLTVIDNIFDRHAYSAYDAGQILTRAIDALGSEYTSEQLNNRIPLAAEDYSSKALIYNTKLNDKGDLACMVYDIFEIDDGSTGFALQTPTQETTDPVNCKRTITEPNAPTVTEIHQRPASAELTWTPATDGTPATEFQVQYKLATASSWTDHSTVSASTTLTVTISGLSNDQEYYFRVIAINSIGGSEASVVVKTTPRAQVFAPNAPTGLTATSLNATAVTLSWAEPADDGGAEVTDYKVEYKLATATNWNTFADGTSDTVSTTVTGLTEGQVYQFRVSATNVQATGAVSNIDIATPTAPAPVATVPNAPTGLTATAGDTTVLLSWTAPSTGDAPTGYTVQQSTDGTSFADSTTVTVTGTTATVTGLTNDQQYTFRVFATNAQGPSAAASNVATATPAAAQTNGGSTPTNTAPVIETITAQTFTVGTAVSVPINATDAEGDTIMYNVMLDPTPTTRPTISGNELTWPAPEAGTYDVTITARDGTTDGNTVSFTLTINRAPVLAPIGAQSGTVGELLTIPLSATDADGDRVTYTISPPLTGATPGNYVKLGTTTTATLTWTPTVADTYDVMIIARDGNIGGIDREPITITITDPAPTPVVYPPRVNFDAGDTVEIPMILDNDVLYESNFFGWFGQAVCRRLCSKCNPKQRYI